MQFKHFVWFHTENVYRKKQTRTIEYPFEMKHSHQMSAEKVKENS